VGEREIYIIYISDRNNMHMRAHTHTDILVIHHSNPFIFSDAFSPARGKREGNPTIFSHFHVHLPLHDLTKNKSNRVISFFALAQRLKCNLNYFKYAPTELGFYS